MKHASGCDADIPGSPGCICSYPEGDVPPLDQSLALRVIARHACETFTTGPGSCFRNGRNPIARFGADVACHACIAWAALLPNEVDA